MRVASGGGGRRLTGEGRDRGDGAHLLDQDRGFNDQVIDRYVLTPTTLDARLYLMRYEQLQTGGVRARDRRYYWVPRWAADYAMSWQVVIDVK